MSPVKISVVMSVFNGEQYLQKSIESILSQTFGDFEFIIIDDASTDRTKDILASYRAQDNRIHIISHEKNKGLTFSLNEGIAQSQGEFIARMDADDISYPQRFEIQLNMLEKNPDLALLGSWADVIDEHGQKIRQKKMPTSVLKIKKKILFNNPFVHSSLLLRKEILQKVGGYNEKFKKSQDYDLVLRIAADYLVENIAEPLVAWRLNPTSLSWKSKEQEKFALLARYYAFRYYGYPKFQAIFHLVWRAVYFLIPLSWKHKRYEN